MAAHSTFWVAGQRRTPSHEKWRFLFLKRWNWRHPVQTSDIVYAQVITKTRQSGLHQKSWLQLPEMFKTQSERCPVKLSQKYLSKRPVGMEKSRLLYLQPIVNPLKTFGIKRRLWELTVSILWWKIWYQTLLFRIVKNTWQTILEEKTLVKKIKQQQVPKSEIISITGHNCEAGLDAYDRGDKGQQKQLYHFIDNHQPNASKNKYSISPSNPIIRTPSFFFLTNDDTFFIKTYQWAILSALIIAQFIFI